VGVPALLGETLCAIAPPVEELSKMPVDSLPNMIDTLQTISSSTRQAIPIEFIGLIGVVLGSLISIVGNMLVGKAMVRRQAIVEIQKSLFLRRLDLYVRLAELASTGYTVARIGNARKGGVFPKPYSTRENLNHWNKQLVTFADTNMLLLDADTYKKLDELNRRLLADLGQIPKSSDKVDILTRDMGQKSCSEIQSHCRTLIESARTHIEHKYRVTLEKVV
jgi:hypothetical protein